MSLLITDLIDKVELNGMMPEGMFTDDEYVSFLNCSLGTDVVPFLMKHREDFFVTYTDYSPTNTIEIPYNAIGAKLQDVVLVLSSNNFLNLPRLTKEEISGSGSNVYTPAGFYTEDNSIIFYPKDKIRDTIRVYYFRRPNELILTSSCAKILSATGAVCTVDQIPTGWTTATEIDVQGYRQPHKITETYTIDSVGASTITLSATGFAVGDYICPKGYAVYAQLPEEMDEILYLGALLKMHVALKDVQAIKAVGEMLKMAQSTASGLLSPRVEGEVKKLVKRSNMFDIPKRSYRRNW